MALTVETTNSKYTHCDLSLTDCCVNHTETPIRAVAVFCDGLFDGESFIV